MSCKKRILLVTICYTPLDKSGALLLEQLALDFKNSSDYEFPVLTVSNSMDDKREERDVIRCWVPPWTESANGLLRVMSEILFAIRVFIFCLTKVRASSGYEGVLVYSPSIFLMPAVSLGLIKKRVCRILILRDIFPDWAIDLGAIPRNKFIRHVLYRTASLQFNLSDYIGAQSLGDMDYLVNNYKVDDKKVFLLRNWSMPSRIQTYPKFDLKNVNHYKYKLLYCGNVGKAQNLLFFIKGLEIAKIESLCLVVVGRGTELEQVKNYIQDRNLEFIYFLDPIRSFELNLLARNFNFGVVTLDRKLSTYNIPGKLLTYLESRLFVLYVSHPHSEVAQILEKYRIGRFFSESDPSELAASLKLAFAELDPDDYLDDKRFDLALKAEFSVSKARDILIEKIGRRSGD